ncbi:MAG: antirestriction protein ArdA, partial [Pyrinomonadaceae bacterium]
SHGDALALDRLDSLFGVIPDEEIGTTQDMGWFGLLRHEGQPGGVVLSRNQYGSRGVWETDSDERLARQWAKLQREHDAFVEATRTHSREPGEREEQEREATNSSHCPEIWVGSLGDYNNGRLHGVWLDATLDPEELRDAIQFMLRNGHGASAEEWAIMDYDDFCGVSLGEYEPLEVVSRVAQGIAEHGEPFAKWVEYVGERSEEALGRFEDHYLGHFESTEAYAEYILEETGSYEFMDYVPESLRPYVEVDTEMMARDMESELYVAEADGGGVLVFDPRC